ncbi:MAG: hypothetical protein HPY45_12135 [Anaerolineae bacterium]|nr:hypothetical protein [Anaerolineae bacterium]
MPQMPVGSKIAMQMPDTVVYMIAGYVAILAILAIYIVSLGVRWKRLQRQLRNLKLKARKE